MVNWFNKTNLSKPSSFITINKLYGYVLPHAGTAHTGHIISNTLRFKPSHINKIKTIIIFYYPSQIKPNINNQYYHEYYVPWKSLQYVSKKWWKNNNIKFIGINIKNNKYKKTIDFKTTLVVISADFSHFLPLQEAIKKENCAAHSLMLGQLQSDLSCNQVIDYKGTFIEVNKLLPKTSIYQWVGRTRSTGEKGVGYLSFLIREQENPNKKLPDGIFITAYDNTMQARECLGNWYDKNNKHWTSENETELKNKVIRLAGTTSRLTGGSNLDIPVTHYTITYLYIDKSNTKNKKFIRGWHGILYNAFYLPDVFLENTFNNGDWISNTDLIWKTGTHFSMDETLNKLVNKAGGNNSNIDYTLYSSNVVHRIVHKNYQFGGNNLLNKFNYIYEPIKNIKLNINSLEGKELLKKYIKTFYKY